jgi:hypothetical protein
LNPFGNAVFHVFAVGVQGDWFRLTGIGKKFQRSDGSLHFHAVVGGLRVCTAEFVTVAIGVANYCAPAARARIAGTSAICVQAFDFGSCHERFNLLFRSMLFAGAIIKAIQIVLLDAVNDPGLKTLGFQPKT